MVNYLKMAQLQTIIQLKKRGWSNRRISSELGIHRDTVNRYVNQRKHQEECSLAQPTTGQETAGLDPGGIPPDNSKPAKAPPGSEPAEIGVPLGSTSRCVGYHDAIAGMLKQEFSAQRIYQDLIIEHNYDGSYYSVKRYVTKLRRVFPVSLKNLKNLEFPQIVGAAVRRFEVTGLR